MPTISMFFGIIIRMYNNGEHNPPHFHASYQGYNAVFDMEGELTDGDMPKPQRKIHCGMGRASQRRAFG